MTKLRLVNQTLVIFEAHKRLLVRPTAHDHCLRQIWTGGLISNVLLYLSSGLTGVFTSNSTIKAWLLATHQVQNHFYIFFTLFSEGKTFT
jgi:hypothetical protein